MGLFSSILLLPLAPVRGTAAIAELLMQQAEAQLYDPAAIRAELQEVEQLRENGDLTDEEAAAREDELVRRLMEGAHRQR